ncbi:helix-turn-helix domain-containing protein [Lacrimispora sp. AGF001]|uniref:helix-turn-helix domain-containing protein n=1 Tax=Lacrimispora sp. AGF001 TaxID=3401631 RepID=UPI003B43B78B
MDSYNVLNVAIQYVEDHIKEIILPEEIAEVCNYSVSNLKYLFHKVFQYGMMEYVNRRKITEAACRLIKTQESVCSVAFYYGFGSQEVFTRAFYKIWQETPGVYRKKRHFYGIYPKQEFICDECGVFRRRFDLTGLTEELNARECSTVVCFDIVGIRFIKTCYGKEAGEAAALHALRRIEELMETECTLYRLAGDKFAVNLGGAGYPAARNAALQVLKANGTSFIVKGNEIFLSMFAGVTHINARGITSKQLFDQLNLTIEEAHKRLFRNFTSPYGFPVFGLFYDDASGLYKGEVSHAHRETQKGSHGFSCKIPCEEINYFFSIDDETEPVRWNTTEKEYHLFFPDGEDWYRKTVFNSCKEVMREHYYIIRNLRYHKDQSLTYTLLHLEITLTADGRVMTLNGGELKEALYEGIISKKEYGKIINTGKSILNRLEKKRE